MAEHKILTNLEEQRELEARRKAAEAGTRDPKAYVSNEMRAHEIHDYKLGIRIAILALLAFILLWHDKIFTGCK